MKILITGNTGFIGSKIVSTLGVSQASLVLPVRNRAVSQCRLGHNVQYKMIGDIDKGTNWHDCLEGVDVNGIHAKIKTQLRSMVVESLRPNLSASS